MFNLTTQFPETQSTFVGFMGWELFDDQSATYINKLQAIRMISIMYDPIHVSRTYLHLRLGR